MSPPTPASSDSPRPGPGTPAGQGPTPLDIDLIEGIVASCTAVAALSGSHQSYLPGRTVPGVSVDTDRVDLYVVARYEVPLTHIADQLATALQTVLAGRTLYVHIEDIVLPGDPLPFPDKALVAASHGSAASIPQTRSGAPGGDERPQPRRPAGPDPPSPSPQGTGDALI